MDNFLVDFLRALIFMEYLPSNFVGVPNLGAGLQHHTSRCDCVTVNSLIKINDERLAIAP